MAILWLHMLLLHSRLFIVACDMFKQTSKSNNKFIFTGIPNSLIHCSHLFQLFSKLLRTFFKIQVCNLSQMESHLMSQFFIIQPKHKLTQQLYLMLNSKPSSWLNIKFCPKLIPSHTCNFTKKYWKSLTGVRILIGTNRINGSPHNEGLI